MISSNVFKNTSAERLTLKINNDIIDLSPGDTVDISQPYNPLIISMPYSSDSNTMMKLLDFDVTSYTVPDYKHENNCLYGVLIHEQGHRYIFAVSCGHTHYLNAHNFTMVVPPLKFITVVSPNNLEFNDIQCFCNTEREMYYNQQLYSDGYLPFLSPRDRLPLTTPILTNTKVFIKRNDNNIQYIKHDLHLRGTKILLRNVETQKLYKLLDNAKLSYILSKLHNGSVHVGMKYTIKFKDCGAYPSIKPDFSDIRSYGSDLEIEECSDSD